MRCILNVTELDYDNDENEVRKFRGEYEVELEVFPRKGDVLYLNEIISPDEFPINYSAEVGMIYFRKHEKQFYYEIYCCL